MIPEEWPTEKRPSLFPCFSVYRTSAPEGKEELGEAVTRRGCYEGSVSERACNGRGAKGEKSRELPKKEGKRKTGEICLCLCV
ncbi:hypothetical protein E2C01_095478 [Portunus trituberculatus]|uniref:Uncharacterized protein n=1 Tax=Portunus trituberculatus TaxID=210409 RepID=A0A5B7JYZ0_PORTR|nr:hypothetical protein [Portunus trituberculatus]